MPLKQLNCYVERNKVFFSSGLEGIIKEYLGIRFG